MRRNLLSLCKNFFRCGLAGWCMEILFTGLTSLRRRDMTLRSVTSLWMFPIYGCFSLLSPVCRLLRKYPLWARGLTYMSVLFFAELTFGKLLSRHRLCPWDYGRSRFNVNGLIRLDFAPCWFGAGLFLERLLSVQRKSC